MPDEFLERLERIKKARQKRKDEDSLKGESVSESSEPSVLPSSISSQNSDESLNKTTLENVVSKSKPLIEGRTVSENKDETTVKLGADISSQSSSKVPGTKLSDTKPAVSEVKKEDANAELKTNKEETKQEPEKKPMQESETKKEESKAQEAVKETPVEVSSSDLASSNSPSTSEIMDMQKQILSVTQSFVDSVNARLDKVEKKLARAPKKSGSSSGQLMLEYTPDLIRGSVCGDEDLFAGHGVGK